MNSLICASWGKLLLNTSFYGSVVLILADIITLFCTSNKGKNSEAIARVHGTYMRQVTFEEIFGRQSRRNGYCFLWAQSAVGVWIQTTDFGWYPIHLWMSLLKEVNKSRKHRCIQFMKTCPFSFDFYYLPIARCADEQKYIQYIIWN